MPITKVPLVHKFGIISLSEAERIIRQQRLQDHNSKRKSYINKSTSCPVITIDFVTKYNSCSEVERGQLNGILKRVLEHAKYKSLQERGRTPPTSNGGRSGQIGERRGGRLRQHDIDISEGWLELIMICQCCGPLQEESLLLLWSSLSTSVICPAHIPALFYISGLCYYWLKTETVSSILRSGELLLLQILHKVALRLYLHHLTGDLQDMCSFVEVQQLEFDMEGFDECKSTYSNFPEALLHWKVAKEIGSLICERYNSYRPLTPVLSLSESQEKDEEDKGTTIQTTPTTTGNLTNNSSMTSGNSNGGHSLSPILWHALDLWQCNKLEHSALPEAIQDLISCNINFKTQNWLEGLLAIEVLCDAALSNEIILHLVQSLAAGNVSSFTNTNTATTSTNKHSRQTSSNDNQPPSLSEYNDVIDENSSKTFTIDSEANAVYSKKAKKPTTLNVLGMQPTFDDALETAESQCTSSNVVEEQEEDENYYDDGDGYDGDGDYESSTRTIQGLSLVSVATQALIDTESIPDTPLSGHSTEYASALCLSSLEMSEIKVTSGDCTSGFINSQNVSMISNLYGKNEKKKTGTQKKVTLISLPQTPVSPPFTDTEDYEMSASDRGSVFKESLIDRVGLLDDRFQFISALKQQAANHHGNTKSVTLTLPFHHRADSRCTHYTHSTAPLSWIGGGVLGSQVPPSTVYQHSILSLSQSIGSAEESSNDGKMNPYNFNTWPLEVQLAYVLNEGEMVINGTDSSIQRMALLGPDNDSTASQYSLVQLSGYKSTVESGKSQVTDDSSNWYIRHCVILSLSRICYYCKDLPTQDGMSEIAWSILQKRISLELEPKVLEANNLHQSCAFKVKSPPLSPTSSSPITASRPTLIGHMAEELANLFLPEIKYNFFPNNPKVKTPQPHKDLYKPLIIDKTKIKPKVDTQRHSQSVYEVESYITKTTNALNKIAEKHWKLQMKQEELEETEKVKLINEQKIRKK